MSRHYCQTNPFSELWFLGPRGRKIAPMAEQNRRRSRKCGLRPPAAKAL